MATELLSMGVAHSDHTLPAVDLNPSPGLCLIHLSNLHSIQRDVRHITGTQFFFFKGMSD